MFLLVFVTLSCHLMVSDFLLSFSMVSALMVSYWLFMCSMVSAVLLYWCQHISKLIVDHQKEVFQQNTQEGMSINKKP